ncbi:MAG TPA: hypothetical protein VH062_02940 [Polyangiaceae bacterium]|nr:hypothetical protein [Polyangiaceae bacterium]
MSVLGLTHGAAAAGANKKAECASAYEQSQELRASAKLHAARESLVICAQGACPSFIQSDCTQWLAELQREMPTVVVAAKNQQGADASGVKVTIDGEPVEAEHEGSAIAVDPGRHTFRFEIDGAPPLERDVVIRQGEKDRIIDVAFATGEVASTPAAQPTLRAPSPDAKPAEDTPESTKPGPLRPYAYAAGGVGAAGIIGFAVFGLVGKGQQSDIEGSGCKPNCSSGDVDSVRTKYILADVSLGIGLAGLGAGVALYFLSQPKTSHTEHAALPLNFDVKTTRNSAFATIGHSF